MKKSFVVSLILLLILNASSVTVSLSAQDSDDDEIFELSPFQVSDRRHSGYRSSSTLSGNRLKTDIQNGDETQVLSNDIGATLSGVETLDDPLFNQARGVRIYFAIGFYDDTESVRKKTLNELIEKARSLAATEPSLHFEPGALIVPQGDRKRGRLQKRSEYTSFAHFTLSFEIEPHKSPFEKALETRRLVSSLKVENDYTRTFYGAAVLINHSPFEQHLGTVLAPIYRSLSNDLVNIGSTIGALTDKLGRAYELDTPEVAVTVVKPADSVVVNFAFDVTEHPDADPINSINSNLQMIQRRVAAQPNLQFAPGPRFVREPAASERIRSDNVSLLGQGQFSISFDVAKEVDPLTLVDQVRSLVSEADWSEQVSKLHYREANLVLDNPNAYRGEILAAILSDLSNLDAQLGEAFSIEPNISRNTVQLKRHSASEVELWIPYSYDVINARKEREDRLQRERQHQVQLAVQAAKTPLCIHRSNCCQPLAPATEN